VWKGDGGGWGGKAACQFCPLPRLWQPRPGRPCLPAAVRCAHPACPRLPLPLHPATNACLPECSAMARRTYALLEHALGKHSPQFILKAEDSTFVNVPALSEALRAHCRCAAWGLGMGSGTGSGVPCAGCPQQQGAAPPAVHYLLRLRPTTTNLGRAIPSRPLWRIMRRDCG
jgi:hypothetical protein